MNYTPSHATDIRKTIKRERERIGENTIKIFVGSITDTPELAIPRCQDVLRQHQRNYGLTARSCRDATGKFAHFDSDDFDVRAMKFASWVLAAALLAVAIWG